MKKHAIEALIGTADTAINAEDWDTLRGIYAEDAVLIVQPGTQAVGHDQIMTAFRAIADYFDHTLDVTQNGMTILEAGDTALVLANTIVSSDNTESVERKATYVFKKHPTDGWLCVIDNSYGHDLIDAKRTVMRHTVTGGKIADMDISKRTM